MSYPPGPENGPGPRPDNPYAKNPHADDPYARGPYGPNSAQPQQPTPQQPGQPPQGGPAYGYPRQPPPAGPYAGHAPYGAGPGSMPGKTSTARVLMYVTAGTQTLFMVLAAIGLLVAAHRFEDVGDVRLGLGLAYALVFFFLVIGLVGLYLATQFNSGRNGLRIGCIVWASFLILCGVFAVTTVGVLWIALGILTIVMLAQSESKSWFGRARY